ncbi:MAG TPA: dockerin type I domain-containing protein [Candidatus Hydrogenedentes bacterium]|nr:dockerin type I domain-containing protein [Candidatus Hydrogenedentota bacterium]
MRILPGWFLLVAVLLSGAAQPRVAYGQEDCDSCGEATLDAVDENWLTDIGYPTEIFRVLLRWEEVANDGSLVCGFRVAAREGGAPFELYRGASGALLDLEDLAALGMSPKTWDFAPLEWPPEIGPGFLLPPAASAGTSAGKSAARKAVQSGRVAERVALPPVNLDAVRREDAAAEAATPKGPVRFGVFRDLPAPLRAGENRQGPEESAEADNWTRLAGSESVWSAEIVSPGAIGIRVHVAEFEAPLSARWYVFDPDDPEGLLEPSPYPSPAGRGDGETFGRSGGAVGRPATTGFWTPTCFSDRVVVACVLPPEASPDSVSLEIDRIIHVYKGFSELPWSKAAGSCNLDVACYGDWANVALGVGGIGTIGSSGSLWCTGSLIVDGDPTTHTPLFMTANHCVGSTAAANNIEVYWLYQNPACGGAAPDPKAVPRTTGGADYLAGGPASSGTDFALLRLRSAPPGGLIYLGLTNAVPPLGTGLTCVHHPRGEFKRISFGALTNSGSPSLGGAPMQSPERFHESLWSLGTTEPGSSGSPLLLNGRQVFIGQLWGGGASCSEPMEPDYYGRFDVTFPLVAGHLGAAISAFDVNASGTVNAADLQVVINVLLGKASTPAADVDRSGVVDARDLQLVVIAVLRER